MKNLGALISKNTKKKPSAMRRRFRPKAALSGAPPSMRSKPVEKRPSPHASSPLPSKPTQPHTNTNLSDTPLVNGTSTAKAVPSSPKSTHRDDDDDDDDALLDELLEEEEDPHQDDDAPKEISMKDAEFIANANADQIIRQFGNAPIESMVSSMVKSGKPMTHQNLPKVVASTEYKRKRSLASHGLSEHDTLEPPSQKLRMPDDDEALMDELFGESSNSDEQDNDDDEGMVDLELDQLVEDDIPIHEDEHAGAPDYTDFTRIDETNPVGFYVNQSYYEKRKRRKHELLPPIDSKDSTQAKRDWHARRTKIEEERAKPFTPQEEALFLKALSQFGTNFVLISRLYLYRTRNDMKSHYERLMKLQRDDVAAALANRIPIDVEAFEGASKAKDAMLGVTRKPFKDESAVPSTPSTSNNRMVIDPNVMDAEIDDGWEEEEDAGDDDEALLSEILDDA